LLCVQASSSDRLDEDTPPLGIFIRIGRIVETIDDGMLAIDAGVRKSDQAGSALESIRVTTKEVYRGGAEAVTITTQVEEVTASAQELAEMAVALQTVVAQFQLNRS
jgi:methyl-accepting chemotaxis protein